MNPFDARRERSKRLEAELAQAEAELREVAQQEEALRREEDNYWRRYDALWLDLQVRPLYCILHMAALEIVFQFLGQGCELG
jgi:hypothetical protein